MKRFLKALGLLMGISVPCLAAPSSPPAGNYITNVSTNANIQIFKVSSGSVSNLTNGLCVQAGPGGVLQSAAGACGTGGGGGVPALQISQSGVQITSPTSSMNFYSGDFNISSVTVSTSAIFLNPATTDYIHNQSSLQSGATFYVSSGTVNILTVGTSLNMNSNLINNVANPVSTTDAVNKQYVDTLSKGSTNYIQNTSSLQTGATFYVSSGTAQNFNASTITVSGSGSGSITLNGSTSGAVTTTVQAAAGTWTETKPTTAGSSGQFLQTNGSGVETWATASGGGSGFSGVNSSGNSIITTTATLLSGTNITMSQAGSTITINSVPTAPLFSMQYDSGGVFTGTPLETVDQSSVSFNNISTVTWVGFSTLTFQSGTGLDTSAGLANLGIVTFAGNSGSINQLLISGGPSSTPTWSTILGNSGTLEVTNGNIQMDYPGGGFSPKVQWNLGGSGAQYIQSVSGTSNGVLNPMIFYVQPTSDGTKWGQDILSGANGFYVDVGTSTSKEFSTGVSGGTDLSISTNGVVTAFGSVQIASNTIMSGATFYQNGPIAFSGTSQYILTVSTSSSGQYTLDISSTGHINGQGIAPTPSTCGTSPTMDAGSTDWHGTINVGGGVVTACTLTFATPFKINPPDCVVSDNSATISSGVTAKSVTAITIGSSATIGGGKISYICVGSD